MVQFGEVLTFLFVN